MPRTLALVLALLSVVHLSDVVARLRPPGGLGPPVPRAGLPRVPIERVGHGVSCLPASEAQRLGVPAFARRCPRPGGVEVACGRIGAARRRLLGAAVDPARATAEELEAVPGIGRVLAARIAAARPADLAALASVPGVGSSRAGRLSAALGLDDPARHDICSMGSWPTTSSGSDRPR